MFSFLSNRASANFSAALTPLGAIAWQEADRCIDFCYWDSYGGKTPPERVDIGYQLIDRRKTIPLDNKRLLVERLSGAGLCDPPAYLELEAVPQNATGLWFIKDPLSSAGRGITVVEATAIAEHFIAGHIIQQAVSEILLFEGRKYTIRLYALIWNGCLYLYPEGITVVHGPAYDAVSTDFAVQIEHNGYMDADSPVSMIRFSQVSGHELLLEDAASRLLPIFRCFADELIPEPDRFCLFGIDYLPRADGTMALIEINDRPNMMHTDDINRSVNSPMIEAMVCQIAGERLNLPTDYEQRFIELGGITS